MNYETLASILEAWNDATNPAKLRTEHEHHRQDQRARAIDNRLARFGWRRNTYWHETLNGRRCVGALCG